jgi:ligand-binding sensor domain-containing protein
MLVTTAKGLAAATAQAFGRDVPLEVLAQPEGLGGPRATSVYVDAQGAIWFGCGSSVCRREGDRVEVWGGAEGVPSDVWQFITKDGAGNLWVRSRRRLIELEAGARRFKTLSLEDVAPLNFAYPSLAFDATGALLVPTNTGLAVLRDGTWSRVGHRQGLPSSTVTAALQDAEGSLWVGTTSGLARWAGYREWESFTEVEGLSGDDILALDEDRAGGIWAGTAGGLSHGAGRTAPGSGPAQAAVWRGLPIWCKRRMEQSGCPRWNRAWCGSTRGPARRNGSGNSMVRRILC